MNWDEVAEALRKTVGKTADKINQTADIASLQVKLSMLEHKLAEAYTALGKVSYLHFSDLDTDRSEAVAKAMENVETAKKNVRLMKAKIEKAKKKDELV